MVPGIGDDDYVSYPENCLLHCRIVNICVDLGLGSLDLCYQDHSQGPSAFARILTLSVH